MRRLDAADVEVLANARQVLADLRPRGAVVARDLDVAVVGADPDLPLGERRFRDGDDRAVELRAAAGIFIGGEPARLAENAVGHVLRQVRAHDAPRVAAIARLEQVVRAEVERPRVELRQDERRAPVPAERAHRRAAAATAAATAPTATASTTAALSWRRRGRRFAPVQ